jgi:hypothetical protein
VSRARLETIDALDVSELGEDVALVESGLLLNVIRQTCMHEINDDTF